MFGLRRRRARSSGSIAGAYGDANRSRSPDSRRPGVQLIFACLLVPRLLSALLNIIHDCDEVFNYWEPLHFLLYGHGMQTWEYSAEYALRSYLYLLVHALVAGPAALWLGAGSGKVVLFYLVRAALGLLSAFTETLLVRAVRDYAGARTAQLLLLLLATSAGMFAAATALLPSSFVMYFLTAAAAAVVAGRPLWVVAAGAVGVLLGWVVAGVAFLPYALYVLATAPFAEALAAAAGVAALVAAPMLVTDRLFYGRWSVTLLNFLRYNVAGGGDSALYGTEGPGFYLRNAASNLNLVLPLALAAPLTGLLLLSRRTGRGVRARLAVAVAPVFVWGAAISALPHKEERFLYPVYPLICLCAAMTLAALPALVRASLSWLLPRQLTHALARLAPRLTCCAIAALSLSRATALVRNYGAPMRLYRHLPQDPLLAPGSNVSYVCLGDEWHRFPSSFHLPAPAYRLAFVKSGFRGLLPRPFDLQQGGTAAAPEQLNDRNEEEPRNYWPDVRRCQFFAGLQERGGPPLQDTREWEELASLPFVDVTRSRSAILRALYVPVLSWRSNYLLDYVLLQRKQQTQASTFLKSIF